MAIDGGTVAVGAYGKGGQKGAVYVFRTSDGGATYGQVAKLTVSDAAYDDNFGYSVAMDGDTVVVGAYSKNSGEGAVYVLRTTDGATYVEVAKLAASDAESGDQFGFSVAIDGHTVVVGTRGGGGAYIFHTSDDGATYIEIAKLTASGAAAVDSFGISVAIDGSTVVVGATGDDSYRGGAVYVFRTSDGGATYGQVAKLADARAAQWDSFGRSVAIDGATIVVGTWGGEAAYILHTSDGGATYVELSKLTAGRPRSWDDFSFSVAIDGATVVAGAYSDNPGGSAYVFGANLPTSQPRPTGPQRQRPRRSPPIRRRRRPSRRPSARRCSSSGRAP